MDTNNLQDKSVEISLDQAEEVAGGARTGMTKCPRCGKTVPWVFLNRHIEVCSLEPTYNWPAPDPAHAGEESRG